MEKEREKRREEREKREKREREKKMEKSENQPLLLNVPQRFFLFSPLSFLYFLFLFSFFSLSFLSLISFSVLLSGFFFVFDVCQTATARIL